MLHDTNPSHHLFVHLLLPSSSFFLLQMYWPSWYFLSMPETSRPFVRPAPLLGDICTAISVTFRSFCSNATAPWNLPLSTPGTPELSYPAWHVSTSSILCTWFIYYGYCLPCLSLLWHRLHDDKDLGLSLTNPKCLEQCLAHREHSINTCWMT